MCKDQKINIESSSHMFRSAGSTIKFSEITAAEMLDGKAGVFSNFDNKGIMIRRSQNSKGLLPLKSKRNANSRHSSNPP